MPWYYEFEVEYLDGTIEVIGLFAEKEIIAWQSVTQKLWRDKNISKVSSIARVK